jgi:hypothetical protein
LHFWAECVLTAIHLINHLPTPLLSHKTPFERLYNKVPNYSHLNVFGCLTYATEVHATHKFAPRVARVFLRYPVGQKAYKLYNPITINSSPTMTLFFMNTFSPTNYLLPFLNLSYNQLNPQLPHQSFPFPSKIFLQQTYQSPFLHLPLQSLLHLPPMCPCHRLQCLSRVRDVAVKIPILKNLGSVYGIYLYFIGPI